MSTVSREFKVQKNDLLRAPRLSDLILAAMCDFAKWQAKAERHFGGPVTVVSIEKIDDYTFRATWRKAP